MYRLGDSHGLTPGVPAVGVYIELRMFADGLPGQPDPSHIPVGLGAPGLADLDLHPGDAQVVHPTTQLLGHGGVVVARETAAAIDPDFLRHLPQQPAQRQPEEFRLQIHKAVSTAALAIDITSGRPKLRQLRTISDQVPGRSSTDVPTTTSRSTSSIRVAQARVA